jgi:hypothetical protein
MGEAWIPFPASQKIKTVLDTVFLEPTTGRGPVIPFPDEKTKAPRVASALFCIQVTQRASKQQGFSRAQRPGIHRSSLAIQQESPFFFRRGLRSAGSPQLRDLCCVSQLMTEANVSGKSGIPLVTTQDWCTVLSLPFTGQTELQAQAQYHGTGEMSFIHGGDTAAMWQGM